jgi:hypothetical protein
MPATTAEIAERGLILRGTVGSTAHGLHLTGTDDRDEMGIAVEPPDRVIGLTEFEQHIHRTAEERLRHDPAADQRYRGRTPPSEAGDLDLTVYSLRKFAKLAANGNPTVQILLFVEPLFVNRWGLLLRENAHLFASKEAGARFLGYLQAQRERLLGQRGQMRVTRSELIERHGYDTKFAMHAVRLGYQGVEYLETGRLTLPMGAGREYCMSVRLGQVPLTEVIGVLEDLERQLSVLTYGRDSLPETVSGRRDYSKGTSRLSEKADRQRLDELLVEIYTDAWDELWDRRRRAK